MAPIGDETLGYDAELESLGEPEVEIPIFTSLGALATQPLVVAADLDERGAAKQRNARAADEVDRHESLEHASFQPPPRAVIEQLPAGIDVPPPAVAQRDRR